MVPTPIQPGEAPADELEELCLFAKKLVDVIEVPLNRPYRFLTGKRNVKADTPCVAASRQGHSLCSKTQNDGGATASD